MKLEKGIISNSQLTFLIGVFIQGSLFCTTFLYSVTYRDIWIATLVSFIMFIIFSFIYINLMRSVPGKNLIQIDDVVFGPYLGKVISSAYIFFFIMLSSVNIRFVCDFIAGIFMGETPLLAFAVIFILLCVWSVYHGLEVLARTSFVFLVLVSISIILIFLLNIDQMAFENFLPILRVPIMDFIQVNHILLSVFFGETFIFLMIMPYVTDQKKVKKSYQLGLLIGEITILIVSVIITSTMDRLSTAVDNPLIVMVREIDVGKVITRMEFVIMCVILFSVFIKVTAIFYAAALSLGQILNLKSYKPLIIPIGVILVALTVPMFDTPIAQAESGSEVWPFFATVFEVLLPVATLITAKIRGISAENGGK